MKNTRTYRGRGKAREAAEREAIAFVRMLSEELTTDCGRDDYGYVCGMLNQFVKEARRIVAKLDGRDEV